VVIVPVSTLSAIPPEQVESILAHELAHIRRHDYLLNLAQNVIEILLFYHPGVRWLSAQVHAERENCCDDVAVAACGDPRVYARALAGLEELRAVSLPAPALAATGGPLLQRIRRLIAPPLVPARAVGPRLAAAAFLLATMSLTGFTFAARAQFPGEEASYTPLPATFQVLEYSPGEEMRLEEACGDSGKLRRCVDPVAGEIRLECVPSSPLALLLWSLGERPRLDDGVRKVVREAPPPVRKTSAPGAVVPEGGEDDGGQGAHIVQRQRLRKVTPATHLPRCGV
jgi:hypothetical protein